MTTYGDNQEPSIITEETSSTTVATSGASPDNLGLVGQADLAKASNAADTGTVYEITRTSTAVERFGPEDSSLLTAGIIDALTEGANPVYAVAAPSTELTGEDISGVSDTTVSLANAPIREAEDSITVELDGTDLTTNRVWDDVSTYSPPAGECYYNPVRGNVELPSQPGDGTLTNDTIAYEYFDYPAAVDTLVSNAGDVIDYLAPVSENSNVVDDGNTTVAEMENEYNLAILLGGADIRLDPSSFTQSYDDSRTQVVYPTRFEDNTSAIAAYAGLKATLGLDETAINKRFTTNKRLAVELGRSERGSLGDADVVALADEARGVRITDDPTTVSDSNTDEQAHQYGFSRKVADYIITTTRTNQRPFIGKLNNRKVRNTLQTLVNNQLTDLRDSGSITSFTVNVFQDSATSVGVEMDVDIAEPIRFINNKVTVEG